LKNRSTWTKRVCFSVHRDFVE